MYCFFSASDSVYQVCILHDDDDLDDLLIDARSLDAAVRAGADYVIDGDGLSEKSQ